MVVDAETDRPIGGAVVVGSWAFERGIGFTGAGGVGRGGDRDRGRRPLPGLLARGPCRRAPRCACGASPSSSIRRATSAGAAIDVFPRGARAVTSASGTTGFGSRSGATVSCTTSTCFFLGGGAAVRAALPVRAAGRSARARWPTGPVIAADGTPVRGRHAALLDATPAAVGGRGARRDRLRGRVRGRPAHRSAQDRLLRQPPFQGARAARELRRRPAGLATCRRPGPEQQFRKLQGELPGASPGNRDWRCLGTGP